MSDSYNPEASIEIGSGVPIIFGIETSGEVDPDHPAFINPDPVSKTKA